MAEVPSISDAEWDVMEAIWPRGTATAAEVIESLRLTKGWKGNTIRTLLSRLVKKGALDFEPDGNRYLYRPKVSREACVEAEGASFLRRFFGGSAQPWLVHLVKKTPLTRKDREELRLLLKKKART